MKKLLGFLLGVVLLTSSVVFAEDAALVEVHNKFCPISHEEIGSGGMTPEKVTHNGKIYSLCCAMCKKDFMQDADKYAKMLDEEAVQEEAEAKK